MSKENRYIEFVLDKLLSEVHWEGERLIYKELWDFVGYVENKFGVRRGEEMMGLWDMYWEQIQGIDG